MTRKMGAGFPGTHRVTFARAHLSGTTYRAKTPVAYATGVCRNQISSIDVVAADIDRAQAHAVTGLDPLLLQAVADAGVDVETAEAEAVAAAVAPTMAPMAAVVEAASGSRRRSGDGERSGGDQSEGNLAKHHILQSSGARPLFRPCTSVGASF